MLDRIRRLLNRPTDEDIERAIIRVLANCPEQEMRGIKLLDAICIDLGRTIGPGRFYPALIRLERHRLWIGSKFVPDTPLDGKPRPRYYWLTPVGRVAINSHQIEIAR